MFVRNECSGGDIATGWVVDCVDMKQCTSGSVTGVVSAIFTDVTHVVVVLREKIYIDTYVVT